MGVFDNLIKVDENGDFATQGWIEWKHMPGGIMHCPMCLVLDKCWFNEAKCPKLPLHEKCHCLGIAIAKPITNVTSRAECPLNKFKEYIFADKYAWNGKRKLFEQLGFTINDSEYLQKEYENQAIKAYVDANYQMGLLNLQGQRINIDIKFEKNERKVSFTSGWMVRKQGLISNNTPFGG